MIADNNLTAELAAELRRDLEQYENLKSSKMGNVNDINEPAYIISRQWLKKWKKCAAPPKRRLVSYYDYDEEDEAKLPGPIDNKDIIDEDKDFYKSKDPNDIYNMILKPKLKDHIDYRILNEKQWLLLFNKFKGTPIKRIKYTKESSGYIETEVYFQQMNIVVLPDRNNFDPKKASEPKILYCSRWWNLSKVRERIFKILTDQRYGFRLELEKFRVWKIEESENLEKALNEAADAIKDKKLNPDTKDVEVNTGVEFPGVPLDIYGKDIIIDKLEIKDTDKIVIEVPNNQGKYIFQCRKTLEIMKCEGCHNKSPVLSSCWCGEAHYCSPQCKKRNESSHREKCPIIDYNEDLTKYKKTDKSKMGLTGLENLGNTCFMNSGLQCLSNTVLLSKYFLNDLYLPDVNKSNAEGLKGKLAHTFAKVIKLLWYGSESSVVTWDFKRTLETKYKIFVGFAQQDSQELISSVLDGLNEDLNRVMIKPYINKPNVTDPNDDSAKDPSWDNFLARNRSIIVDLFYGQYKSVLQCPKCEKYSVTFDPFSIISLPIPQENIIRVKITYIPYNFKQEGIKTSIAVNKTSTIDELRNSLFENFGISKYGTILSMITSKSLDRLLARDELVKVIHEFQQKGASLYVQEINPKYSEDPRYISKVEENKESAAKVKDNNNLIDDLVMVPLVIYGIDMGHPSPRQKMKTITRVLYTKKSYTLKELYMEIFRFLRPLYERAFSKLEAYSEPYIEMTDEVLFNKLFPDLTEENWKLNLEDTREVPYTLKFINVNQEEDADSPCVYCKDPNCQNCTVPYTSKVNVGSMIDKLGSKEDSLYVQKLNTSPKYFMLEVLFNKNNEKAMVNNLNFEPVDEAWESILEDNAETTIYNCLDKFMEWEKLDQNNLWYCPTCKFKLPARKRLELIRVPPILVLHLKRFKTNTEGRIVEGDRIDKYIDFPLTDLDLARYLKSHSPILYDLYAVSNHMGTTLSGHYTACAWNEKEKCWYQYDDSRVAKKTENICTSAAYVLFYKRKDLSSDIDYSLIRQGY